MWWKQLFIICLAILPFSIALSPSKNLDLPLIRVLTLALFLLWIASSLIKKDLRIDVRLHFWLFLSFILFACLSLTWAIQPERGIRKAIFLLSFLPIWLATFSYAQENNKNFIAKVITYSSCALAITGIFQFSLQFILGLDPTLKILTTVAPIFLGESFSTMVLAYPSWLVNINGNTLLRAFGTFPDPHLFALFLNMTIPFSVYLYQKDKKRPILVIILISILASLLSFSRAAFVTLAIMGLFFLLLNHKNAIAKNPIPSLIITLALILTIIFPNPISQRFFSTFNFKEGSVSGRLEMWQKSIKAIGLYPAQGVGLGNFPYFVEPQSSLRTPIYAHNLFLDFASELGILGATLLALMFLYPLFRSIKSPTPYNLAIFFSLLAFLVTSMFETPVFSVNIYPLLLVILALPYEN